jgi:hypothetical protein
MIFRLASLLFRFLLLLLLGGCVSTLPITQGPKNLDKGETDLYWSASVHASSWNFWEDAGKSGHSEFATTALGANYGLRKFMNIGAILWAGIAAEIGMGPQCSFQLLQGRKNLNLCLKGGAACPFSFPEASLALIGTPELIWGPCEYFFIGLRYNYRWYKKKIDPVNENNNQIGSIKEAHAWDAHTIGIFIASDYRPRVGNMVPFFIFNVDPVNKFWQASFGFSHHFLHSQSIR